MPSVLIEIRRQYTQEQEIALMEAVHAALREPSTPGVFAPLDASVMRAASTSQVLSAISLKSRSTRAYRVVTHPHYR